MSNGGDFMRKLAVLIVLFATAFPCPAAEKATTDAPMSATAFKGLEFRSIGPALMSGRIADIAIHPNDFSTWYVAVGSGGVTRS